MAASVTYSIVIPTLNEARYIPQLLRDLSKQTMTNFEVIVVDGTSTDQTVKKVESFQSKLTLRVLESSEANVSVQRNLGAKSARAPWVLFMDADNRLPTHFLQGIAYYLAKHPRCDVFTCLLEPDERSSSTQLVCQAINTAMQLQYKAKTYFAIGALIGVRRSLLKTTQFEPNYTVGEEQIFIRSLIKRGASFSVVSDPSYTYSFRRLRKEGMLRVTATNAKVFLLSLGKLALTDQNHGYYMLGGAQYLEPHPQRTPQSIGSSLLKLSKSQLDKIKQLFDWTAEGTHEKN